MYFPNNVPCPVCHLVVRSHPLNHVKACMRGSTVKQCEEAFLEAKLKSRAFTERNEVTDMAQVRSNLTDAGYPQPTAGQLRLATRLMRACGALITDIPRHLSEALRPPPGFQALEPADAGAPDAGAPEADAVHLSGDEETDVPPGVGRRPLPLPANPMMMMMMMKYPVPSQTPAHQTPAHQRQTPPFTYRVTVRPMSPPSRTSSPPPYPSPMMMMMMMMK